MNIHLIPIIVSIIAVLIATYTDLKKRKIPNKLTIFMILFGILFHLIIGIKDWNLLLSLYGFFGVIIGFSLGFFMYAFGGCAAGDVKLIAGLGALLPTSSSYIGIVSQKFFTYSAIPQYTQEYPLFPFMILFNTIIIAMITIVLHSFLERIKGKSIGLYDYSKITELEKGAIPDESIYLTDGKVRRKERGSSILSFGEKNKRYDEKIVEMGNVNGITNEQIDTLKDLVNEGKMKNKIRIKRGMPFAPMMFVGVLISIFYGSLYLGLLHCF